jgi:16S rRNA processing protein RimM
MTSAPQVDDGLVLVGIVVRPHGLKGEVAIEPQTDFPDERFAPGAALLVDRGGRLETLTIATERRHQGRPLVTFAGREGIDAVEPLRGARLWIRERERAALEPGRFYHSQLVGCRVETMDGAAVGHVVAVEATGGVPLLVVQGSAGEVLVPLAEAICRRIEPEARRIVIEPPDGLLELNAGSRGRTR